jgi:hypothetical protein
VCENRVFGRERDEITGDWTRLHNEDLYALYSYSYSNSRVIKSIRIISSGYVTRMGDRGGA